MSATRPSGALSVLAVLALVLPGPVQARPSTSPPPAALARLGHQLDRAARAARRHRVLPAGAYRAIARSASQARRALPAPSAGCRDALAAAGRLKDERRHRARLAADLRRARKALGACSGSTAGPAMPVPPDPPAPPSGPSAPDAVVAGTVVRSDGRPLAGLPLRLVATTSARGELYGSSTYAAVTDAAGVFRVPVDPAHIGALAWRAEADFPWYGGTWTRNLATISQGDPAHLAFRADLTASSVPAFASPTVGASLRLSDWGGCTSLGPDSDFPASDPGTAAVVLSFVPAGPLLDGTAGAPVTRTVPASQLCLDRDAVGDIPAGAWRVTAATDTGRRLTLSRDPDAPGASTATLFAAPADQSSPLERLYVAFAA